MVADCSSKFYAACRATKQPYNWTITTYVVSYSFADAACPDDHDFAVPRTALENSYLRQAMRESDRDYDGHGAVSSYFKQLSLPNNFVDGRALLQVSRVNLLCDPTLFHVEVLADSHHVVGGFQ